MGPYSTAKTVSYYVLASDSANNQKYSSAESFTINPSTPSPSPTPKSSTTTTSIRPVTPAPPVTDSCSSYSSCSLCTTAASCGWAKNSNNCKTGTIDRANDGSASAIDNSWAWSSDECPVVQSTPSPTPAPQSSTTTTTTIRPATASTQTPAGKPDLIIESVKFVKSAAGGTTANVLVKNAGRMDFVERGDLLGNMLKLVVLSIEQYRQPVGSLIAGQSKTIEINLGNLYDGKEITAEVDANKMLDESDETNNKFKAIVRVETAPASTPTAASLPLKKRVFVTSTSYDGAEIGGLASGDAKCNALAAAARLGGTWKAWLSSSAENAAARIFGSGDWGYERIDGTTVADDKADLLDGSIDNPISKDETGQEVYPYGVWTGTRKDGTAGAHCNGWASSSDDKTGTIGRADYADKKWTHEADTAACSNKVRLYCFEVGVPPPKIVSFEAPKSIMVDVSSKIKMRVKGLSSISSSLHLMNLNGWRRTMPDVKTECKNEECIVELPFTLEKEGENYVYVGSSYDDKVITYPAVQQGTAIKKGETNTEFAKLIGKNKMTYTIFDPPMLTVYVDNNMEQYKLNYDDLYKYYYTHTKYDDNNVLQFKFNSDDYSTLYIDKIPVVPVLALPRPVAELEKSCPASSQFDLNSDGKTDDNDANICKPHMDKNAEGEAARCDFNGDCRIDLKDMEVFASTCKAPESLACHSEKGDNNPNWAAVPGASVYRFEWCYKNFNFEEADFKNGNCGYITTGIVNIRLDFPKPLRDSEYKTRVMVKSSSSCKAPGGWSAVKSCSVAPAPPEVSLSVDKTAAFKGETLKVSAKARSELGLQNIQIYYGTSDVLEYIKDTACNGKKECESAFKITVPEGKKMHIAGDAWYSIISGFLLIKNKPAEIKGRKFELIEATLIKTGGVEIPTARINVGGSLIELDYGEKYMIEGLVVELVNIVQGEGSVYIHVLEPLAVDIVNLEAAVAPEKGAVGTTFSAVINAVPGLQLSTEISSADGVKRIYALYDDGEHGDRKRGDGVYGNVISGLGTGVYFVNALSGTTQKVLAENIASFAVSSPGTDCLPLIKNMGAETAVDVVFVTNHYDGGEFRDIEPKLISKHANHMLSKEPFKTNGGRFNFWYLKDANQVDCSYASAGDCASAFKKKVSAACSFYDQIIVLDKNNLKGAGGYSFGYGSKFAVIGEASTPGTEYSTVHEFGHSFAGLADEYQAVSAKSAVKGPNCDEFGCPKWCSGKSGLTKPECYLKTDESSCKALKYNYNGEAYSCQWYVENKKCDMPYKTGVDFGSGCRSGTACYYQCGGTEGYRSSEESIMGFSQISEFNEVSKEHIQNVLDCVYPAGTYYDSEKCSEWSEKNNGAWAESISRFVESAPQESAESENDCTKVTDGMRITSSTKLCKGEYRFAKKGTSGVITIDANNVVLDCNGASIIGINGDGVGIYNNGHNDVEIQNCRIRNFFYGVYSEKGDNIRIINNDISGNKIVIGTGWINIRKGPNNPYGGGVYLKKSDGSLITGNTLKNQQDGIDLFEVTNTVVRKNIASHNFGWGVQLYASSNNEVSDNDFSYTNRFCDSGQKAKQCKLGGFESPIYGCGCDSAAMLVIARSNDNKILRNDLRYSGDGFFLAGGTDIGPSEGNTVIGNDGSFSPHNAFESTFSGRNTFAENTATDSDHGFWLGYSYDNVVQNNIIANNKNEGGTSSGISIENGRDNKIEDNIIFGNDRGIRIWLPEETIKGYERSSKGYKVKDNTIKENAVGLVVEHTTDSVISGNKFIDNEKEIQERETTGIVKSNNEITKGENV